MIYCCGSCCEPLETVFILPSFQYRDRKLEVSRCPVCGALHAKVTQFNVKTQQYETFQPRRKKIKKFIDSVKDGKWFKVNVKYGTPAAAGFVFGLNKELKNGDIKQYSVDFNGTKKLVKIIKQDK
ncbi:MAG: hypothetical protein LUG16_07785 [Candidatus Gastranaerophilales bacterium]|nr:hypothetical protein [Candidatus Gastranaerophilales bacterium]